MILPKRNLQKNYIEEKRKEIPVNHSGIDLHKDNCFMVTTDDAGLIKGQGRIPTEKEEVIKYFKNIPGEHRAVVESTSSWYWLNDLLSEAGIELQLAHSKYLKAISYAKVKTDKVDANTLSKLLRMDFIPQAHKISEERRAQRDHIRRRLSFVEKRTSCYNSIHRIGEKFNCDKEINIERAKIPEDLPEENKMHLKFLFQQVELINLQIYEIEKSLQSKLMPDVDMRKLLAVPGIGPITAYSLYLEIDGIDRFESVKNFFSYCRLVPGAKNSNRTKKQKSGCKDGNRYLKVAFTDAGVHAVRYSPEIKSFYNRQLRKHNKPIARTLVAKELAKVVFYILKKKEEYKGFKGKPNINPKKQYWPRLASPIALSGT
jgi:transposase